MMNPGALFPLLAKASLHRRCCRRCGQPLTEEPKDKVEDEQKPVPLAEIEHRCQQCRHLSDEQLAQLRERRTQGNRSLGWLFLAAAAVVLALVLLLLVLS